jgi:hypothetical protein
MARAGAAGGQARDAKYFSQICKSEAEFMPADAVVAQDADAPMEVGRELWRHRYRRRYIALFLRGLLQARRWLARLNGQAGISGANMEMSYDTTAVAAAQLRQFNGQSPPGNATQAGKLRPEIFGMIIGALHDSRRRRSEHLLRHDYRHLICPPNQESERNY